YKGFRCSCNSTANTRYYFGLYPFSCNMVIFLHTPTKDQRVPPLKTNHIMSGLCSFNQHTVDLCLGIGMPVATLANTDLLGTEPIQIRCIQEIIVEYNISNV